eukprot:5715181-Amphidinium_carterae.1
MHIHNKSVRTQSSDIGLCCYAERSHGPYSLKKEALTFWVLTEAGALCTGKLTTKVDKTTVS